MFSTSAKGIKLIKHYEGCSLTAYQDSVGVWTIGYGTTTNVKPGMKITQKQADEFLLSDIKKFESLVNKAVTSRINQDQFDALISFIYNIGPGKKDVKDGLITLKNGKPSTLLNDVNASRFSQTAKDFLSWNKAGGVVLNGLVKRRQSESTLFSTGVLDFEKPGTTYV